jgi:aminopeptidase N
MTFISTIPADSSGSYGIYTHETQNGTWVLADWYPILSVWEEGSGWALPPVTSFGDPTYAPSAFYDVTLSAPEDLAVMATGVVAGETAADGIATRRFAAGPARDFVIVADDDETPLRRSVDGTQVTLWTAPNIDHAIATRTLDLATEALHFYNDQFGQLPAREIDLVQTNPRGALGIAWTGLVFLDGPGLLATYGEHDPEGLAAIVGHEVSHLWWGVMVGGDSNKHGFIQEGLATVSSLLFLQESMGAKAASEGLEVWVIRPSRDLLASGDAVVDLASTDGDDETIRSNAIYGKGSLGFLAIRQAIGAEAFETGLHDAATRYAWSEMTPDQLREAFERASGQDLAALWSHWFDETALTEAEIDALAQTFDQKR